MNNPDPPTTEPTTEPTTTDPAPAPTPECSRCGTVSAHRRGRPPRCHRCRVVSQLEKVVPAVLASPELRPLVEHLGANPNPSKVVNWLRGASAELLHALAVGDIALTREGLHTWPSAPAVQHLRHLLIACGVLPAVDPHLTDFERWLHQRLTALAGHPHEQLLHRFAVWHQLPRLRAEAATRLLRPTARNYATDQFCAAAVLLTWLHEHQTEPHQLTQPVLDQWYLEHRLHHRYRIRGFLLWATEHGHLPGHLRISQVAFRSGASLTQHRRIELLRHYLDHDGLPLVARTAACLTLLYAQPVSRILRLTLDDLTYIAGELHLRFGEPASPVPAPIAALLQEVIDSNERRGHNGRWLFPGRVPDQPIAYRTLITALQRLDFPLMEARTAALRELVQQAPAPVVAAALGFHRTTTTRQSRHAGVPWNRYPNQAR